MFILVFFRKLGGGAGGIGCFPAAAILLFLLLEALHLSASIAVGIYQAGDWLVNNVPVLGTIIAGLMMIISFFLNAILMAFILGVHGACSIWFVIRYFIGCVCS